jgi:hypothetical protein
MANGPHLSCWPVLAGATARQFTVLSASREGQGIHFACSLSAIR